MFIGPTPVVTRPSRMRGLVALCAFAVRLLRADALPAQLRTASD